jgi:hypothetical protein
MKRLAIVAAVLVVAAACTAREDRAASDTGATGAALTPAPADTGAMRTDTGMMRHDTGMMKTDTGRRRDTGTAKTKRPPQ